MSETLDDATLKKIEQMYDLGERNAFWRQDHYERLRDCIPSLIATIRGLRADGDALVDRLAAPEWTREPPKVPGFYWLRAGDFDGVRLVVNEVVRVHEEFGPAYVVGFGWGRYVEKMPAHAEWSGPLPSPQGANNA